MALVKVTDANKNERYVPERWLDHPELGKGLTRVPTKKADKPAAAKSNADK
jgi:hypothetical protein